MDRITQKRLANLEAKHPTTSLLDQICRETEATERKYRLSGFFWILVLAKMADDPRLDPAIVSEAREAYSHWAWHDPSYAPNYPPLDSDTGEYLLRELKQQEVTLLDCWTEFSDLPFPEFEQPKPNPPKPVRRAETGSVQFVLQLAG